MVEGAARSGGQGSPLSSSSHRTPSDPPFHPRRAYDAAGRAEPRGNGTARIWPHPSLGPGRVLAPFSLNFTPFGVQAGRVFLFVALSGLWSAVDPSSRVECRHTFVYQSRYCHVQVCPDEPLSVRWKSSCNFS